MKRGAERQITKDEGEDEIEEVSSSGPFAKADSAALAARKIKGMPRRAEASPSPSPFLAESPSKFSSFSGFGTSATTSNPFSFTPPASSPSFPTPPKPASNPFAVSPSTPTPTLFSSGTPAVASTASNAAKTFASILGDSSTKAAASTESLSSASDSTPPDEAALKYYKSLRGLNVSILDAITKAIDQDPFADVASVLKSYSDMRLGFQKEFDSKSKPEVSRSSAPSPSPGAPTPSAPTPASAPKMPAAPAAFTSFGGKPLASSTSAPALKASDDAKTTSGGPTPLSNPFSFGSSSSSTALKPSLFTPSPTPSLTASDDAKATSGAPTAPSNPFSSSSSSSTTAPKPSLFTTPTASPSPFSSTSAFGSAAVPPSSGISFGSGASTSASTKTSLFGAPASPSPSPFGVVAAAKAPTSLFGSGGSSSAFGASSLGASTTPFSFGGKGSIGNPVGFAFGSPKVDETEKKSEGEVETDEVTESGSGESQTAESGESQSQETGTTQGTSQGTSQSMLFGADDGSGLDAEGEGEEDEETVHGARVKAFRLKKLEGGGNGGWLDIGIGMLRLKKHKETSARRLLLRNTHSGKIQINFALYSGLKPSQSKKALTFVGHDEAGESQTYSLRFRSEDAAKEFNTLLMREVGQVKAG